MKKFLRAVLAITICLSGWALLPLASMPTQAFGWELFAGAYGEIFGDGFETGDTSRWTRAVRELDFFAATDVDDFAMTFRIDDTKWGSDGRHIVTLATAVSEKGVPVFKIEARRHGFTMQLRGRAASEPNVWAESPWRSVDEPYESIEILWRRALPVTEDGLLYISVDDDLLLWLVDLDNSALPLREIHMEVLGGRPLAQGISGTLRPIDASEVK